MKSSTGRVTRVFAALAFVAGAVALLFPQAATAAPGAVGLGTADSFGVLAGQGIQNTGPTVIGGDLGTCPNPAVVGFPPGTVGGTIHANDAVACSAQADTTTAYNDAAGRAPTTTYPGDTDLGGKTLVAGVYKTAGTYGITGTLTLDGQNDPDSVFIFQTASTVITATNSSVSMINGAQACNVFWQVGSSATLGVGSKMIGTVIALTAISALTNATVDGRLLTRNAALTLDSNQVRPAACGAATATTTTDAAGATTTTTTGGGGGAATTTTSSTTTSSTTLGVTSTTVAATPTTLVSGQVGGDVLAASVNQTPTARSLAASGGVATWQPLFGFLSLMLGALLLAVSRIRRLAELLE